MSVDTFLNLLKNVVDKNNPLVYSRFNNTIWTVSGLYIYKDIKDISNTGHLYV